MKLGIGIITDTPLGCVLGAALRRSGHTTIGVNAPEGMIEKAGALLGGVPHMSVGEIARVCELVLIDASIERIEQILADGQWQSGQLVIHTNPAAGSTILAPVTAAGGLALAIHPAMSVSGTSLDIDRLSGSPIAVSGPPLILPIAHALAADMGGVSFEVTDTDRDRYLSALAMISAFPAVLDRIKEISATAGIDDPDSFIAPLIKTMVRGAGHISVDIHEHVGESLDGTDRDLFNVMTTVLSEQDEI